MLAECLFECQELAKKILQRETEKSDHGETTNQESELDRCQVKKPKTSDDASNLHELQGTLMAKMKHVVEEMKHENEKIMDELTNFQMRQMQERIGVAFEDKDECSNEIEALYVFEYCTPSNLLRKQRHFTDVNQ